MCPAGFIPPGTFVCAYGRLAGYGGPSLPFGHNVMTRAAYGDLFGRIGSGRPGPPVQTVDMVRLCRDADTDTGHCQLAAAARAV